MKFKIIFIIILFGFNQIINLSDNRNLSELDKRFFNMHPCRGVFVCGCYVTNNNKVDRICDIGCEPLHDIRCKHQEVCYGCHCADEECLQKGCTKICWRVCSDWDDAICSKSGILCVTACLNIPFKLDLEELEVTHSKKIALHWTTLLDNPFESIQDNTQKIFIPNPCQKKTMK